jgi:hypothetical protein
MTGVDIKKLTHNLWGTGAVCRAKAYTYHARNTPVWIARLASEYRPETRVPAPAFKKVAAGSGTKRLSKTLFPLLSTSDKFLLTYANVCSIVCICQAVY